MSLVHLKKRQFALSRLCLIFLWSTGGVDLRGSYMARSRDWYVSTLLLTCWLELGTASIAGEAGNDDSNEQNPHNKILSDKKLMKSITVTPKLHCMVRVKVHSILEECSQTNKKWKVVAWLLCVARAASSRCERI